jgi:DNA-binding transcriptional regulator YiaG
MTDDRTSAVAASGGERVLPSFEEKLMGIPIVLVHSAIQTEINGETGIIVPDPEELRAAVAIARVTLPYKLMGKEIRALRKAICMRANTLAEFLDVTPETFSRWENGKEPISNNAERLLRLRVYQTLRAQVKGVMTTKSEDILELKISPVRLVTKPFALVFQRIRAPDGGNIWWFLGMDEPETPEIQVA